MSDYLGQTIKGTIWLYEDDAVTPITGKVEADFTVHRAFDSAGTAVSVTITEKNSGTHPGAYKWIFLPTTVDTWSVQIDYNVTGVVRKFSGDFTVNNNPLDESTTGHDTDSLGYRVEAIFRRAIELGQS